MRPDALRFIKEGIEASKTNDAKPSYISPNEWGEQQRIARSNLFFVRGAIQKQEGETAQAEESFQFALDIGKEQTDKNTYQMYVDLLKSSGRDDKAVSVAELAIRRGASTQQVVNNYREIKKKQGLDEKAVEARLATLREEGRSMLVERLSREMLNQRLIDGQFVDLDGKAVKISDWKGKVVILDYWATWCGPCRKSFPSMQKLYEQYKGNPEVQFAIVNVWERVDDRDKHVREFLEKNSDLTFPVFFDKDDEVVSKYGVTGIPTKFYLGKDGRVQFKEVGYLPEEQFIRDATQKIEVLLAQ